VTKGSTRVLVVEDYEHMRDILTDVLVEAGYAVETAAHGGEALARAREALPDMILLDLNMPQMNGWELWQALRELPGGQDVKLILLTADESGPAEAARLGAHACLMKPFDLDELLATVQRVASGGRSELS
jgi:CheY-like chemotaxis protein